MNTEGNETPTTTISLPLVGGAVGMRVECYPKNGYLMSDNAKDLKKLFDVWEQKKLKDTPYHLYDEAWEVYLLQIVRDMLFDNAGSSLDWIPKSFYDVSFKTQGILDYNRFKHFVNFIEGFDYSPIYKMDEDSSETMLWILDEYGKENGSAKKE